MGLAGGRSGADPTRRTGSQRGSCVSPSVHREPALHRHRGGTPRASLRRRRSQPGCASGRSGNRTPARLRVRRLRGPRRRRRSDPAIQSATIQRPAARRERGASARRARTWRISGPRPGGFSGPRPGAPGGAPADRAGRIRGRRGPGGFAPRPDAGGAPGTARNRNFGPDAPPKNKRKPPRKDGDRGPKGPIKERPVGRLYDADEDWRAQDEDLDVDNVATSAKDDDADKEIDKEIDKEKDDDQS